MESPLRLRSIGDRLHGGGLLTQQPATERHHRKCRQVGQEQLLQTATLPRYAGPSPAISPVAPGGQLSAPFAGDRVIPAERLGQEQQRLRPAKVQADELALRVPVSVGVTGYVIHDTHPYSMPPEAAGLPATLYLYRDRVRIIAGRHQAEHPRLNGRKEQSTLPEHRSAQLAVLSGKRGKRYLKRQHLFDTGEAAVEFLTELVHANPRGWIRDVELLHDLLQRHGSDAMNRAFRAAVDVKRFDAQYVGQSLSSAQHESIPLFPSEVPA